MVASLEDTLEVHPDRLPPAKLFIFTLDATKIHRDGSDSVASWAGDNALTIDGWIRRWSRDDYDVFD